MSEEKSASHWVQILVALLALLGVVLGIVYKYFGDQEIAMIPIRATQAAESRGTEIAASATAVAALNTKTPTIIPSPVPSAMPIFIPTVVPPSPQVITVVAQPTLAPAASPVDAKPNLVTLNWGPTFCRTNDAVIVLGTCLSPQYRDLKWLKIQLLRLKSFSVYPLNLISDNFALNTQPNPVWPYERHWFLNIESSGTVYNVTVGYESSAGLQIRSKDGVRLLSPSLLLDKNEQWWAQDGYNSFRQITK